MGLSNRQVINDIAVNFIGSLYYQKGVPWKMEVEKTVGILRDMGFVQKAINDPIPLEARLRWRATQPPLEPLQLGHFFLPSIVQYCGWLIALVAFGFEI